MSASTVGILPLPGPRKLLNATQDAQMEATGETLTVTKIHAYLLDSDEEERVLDAREIELAKACICGSGELQLPIIDRRVRIERTQNRLIRKAQEHLALLAEFQRRANGLLEQLRVMVCRFLANGGSMEVPVPVQLASYRRRGADKAVQS